MPQVKLITSSELIFVVDETDIAEAEELAEGISGSDRILKGYLDRDPIAVALKKIGKYRTVLVGWFTLDGYKGPVTDRFQITNDEEVRKFLSAFDRDMEVEPIEVQLFFQERRFASRSYDTVKKTTPREKIVLSRGGKVIP